MKLKGLGPALLAAMILMALAANSARATTLEVGGVKQAGSVTVRATSSGLLALVPTGYLEFETCTTSAIEFSTQVVTGTTVNGPVIKLTTSGCSFEPTVVDATGTFSIEAIAGTTNGTVRSTGAKWTTALPPYGTLTCTTNNSDLGVLTGTSKGFAVLHLNVVLNCGVLLPSATWKGTYTVTSPEGLGVVS